MLAEALSQAILEGDKEAFHDIISGYLSVINKVYEIVSNEIQAAEFNVDFITSTEQEKQNIRNKNEQKIIRPSNINELCRG